LSGATALPTSQTRRMSASAATRSPAPLCAGVSGVAVETGVYRAMRAEMPQGGRCTLAHRSAIARRNSALALAGSICSTALASQVAWTKERSLRCTSARLL
jgi:hypothetical protein